MDKDFITTMEEIVAAIKAAGYDPYDQLCGYITKGKEEYITRSGGAREKIKKLNWLQLKNYVEQMEKDSEN